MSVGGGGWGGINGGCPVKQSEKTKKKKAEKTPGGLTGKLNSQQPIKGKDW